MCPRAGLDGCGNPYCPLGFDIQTVQFVACRAIPTELLRPIFIVWGKHTSYEDGTDRVFRNVGT